MKFIVKPQKKYKCGYCFSCSTNCGNYCVTQVICTYYIINKRR
ncbi:Clo7bot family Cys-rich peptide [Tepidibacter hydrothermalis]|uniref:Clo7bot family Cys-rich peptide n=1 Tax=Tepidibacter hydrothermalis TaxID=3036126 RepID=A0ABY8EFZ0_9FIRM|nr:Clo7bot family Cys-rich peptide [Tepidibacter hydrothermalis]WFD10765.1 Clo7bot family Cys-rich peptide [Tepidibacter hydrothermalis]